MPTKATKTVEADGSIQISVRVEPNLVSRADELLNYVTERTGRPSKRSDVWREVIITGMRELERQAPQAAAKKRVR